METGTAAGSRGRSTTPSATPSALESDFCEVCGKPRRLTATLFGRTLDLKAMCDCERAAYERQKADDERRNSGALAAERLRVARAFQSPSMRSKTFDADDGRGGEAMRQAKAYADRLAEGLDFGLLLFGEPDGGKTFTSCCVANAALDLGMSVVMRSLPWLISNRDEWTADGLAACDLLVLDDLGAERATSYGQELVYSVVDARYCAGRPMVVSTNLTRDQLANPADVASARIYGRVLECCLPVEVKTGRRRASRERYDLMRERLGIGAE